MQSTKRSHLLTVHQSELLVLLPDWLPAVSVYPCLFELVTSSVMKTREFVPGRNRSVSLKHTQWRTEWKSDDSYMFIKGDVCDLCDLDGLCAGETSIMSLILPLPPFACRRTKLTTKG